MSAFTPSKSAVLEHLLVMSFAGFVFCSTFSIAAGSVGAGVSSILFLLVAIQLRYQPFSGDLKWSYLFCGLYTFWMILAGQIATAGVSELDKVRHEWLFCVVPVGAWLLQSDRWRRWILFAFAVGVFMISVYGIGQFFWGWTFLKSGLQLQSHESGYWVVGNFNSPYSFGIFYAVAGVFFLGYVLSPWGELGGMLKAFYLGTAIVSTVAAVLSSERGPVFAIAVALLVCAFAYRSRRIAISIAVGLALLVSVGLVSGVFSRVSTLFEKELSDNHDMGRLFIWTHSLKLALAHPVFGVGPGHFEQEYPSVVRPDFPGLAPQGSAHNDILNVAAISGFPGALFFLAIWMLILRQTWSGFKSKSLTREEQGVALGALLGSVCFFVSSMFDIPFVHVATRQMLMFVWSAGLAMYLKSKVARTAP